ncbi:MAG: hypothetical protein L0J35_00060 [Tetragenococcus halophilus]|nr:hypothetical protein [Tetragenococcus halophilus]
MARKRKELTMESNIDKITQKIHDKPYKVMNTIGQQLVREVRSTTLRSQFHTRRKILHKSLGYWARKRENDLQIGFKMSILGIVGKMLTGQEKDPLKPVVIKNKDLIQKMIGQALDEIRKE